MLGVREVRRLYQLTINAVDLILQRARQYGIECDLVDQGVLRYRGKRISYRCTVRPSYTAVLTGSAAQGPAAAVPARMA
jgi:hypothetical protein